MIPLVPFSPLAFSCPACGEALETEGWCIPGMRTMADLTCPGCEQRYFGDLPVGHGLYAPCLIAQESGDVYDLSGTGWHADWLCESYADPVDQPVAFSVERFQPVGQPVLLNCLDALYGHSLLKLLNAQYYLDHRPDCSVIVLVPRFLRWMVPDGVAEVWTVEFPLARGLEWNTWLAAEIGRRVQALGDACWLSLAFSHPHPDDFDIERFTRVHPFDLAGWTTYPERPTVTFIYREDRVWADERVQGLKEQLRLRLRRAMRRPKRPLHVQMDAIVRLAEQLREAMPGLEFGVVGFGTHGRFPEWVSDLREVAVDEVRERAWCERYAGSHVVIGVHGSHMLLPSAHAGSVVDLMPLSRWGNMVQDVLTNEKDVRAMAYRYRFLPLESSIGTVARVVQSLLEGMQSASSMFTKPWCDHRSADALQLRNVFEVR